MLNDDIWSASDPSLDRRDHLKNVSVFEKKSTFLSFCLYFYIFSSAAGTWFLILFKAQKVYRGDNVNTPKYFLSGFLSGTLYYLKNFPPLRGGILLFSKNIYKKSCLRRTTCRFINIITLYRFHTTQADNYGYHAFSQLPKTTIRTRSRRWEIYISEKISIF